MTIENATYLKQLNASYPTDGDLIKEGDDHIRLIKKTLRNSFKNIDKQVLISSDQLNELVSYKTYIREQIQNIYPVGSIFVSTVGTGPSVQLGFGTWEAISQGRVLVGAGEGTDAAGASKLFGSGSTGGEYSHTLTEAEMPAHNHKPQSASNKTSSKADAIKFRAIVPAKPDPRGQVGRSIKYNAPVSRTSGTLEIEGFSFPPHTHSVDDVLGSMVSSGGGASHNNIQPYLTVFMWKRTY